MKIKNLNSLYPGFKIHYITSTLFVLALVLLLILWLRTFVVDHTVSSHSKEDDIMSWEEYLIDREKRNIAKMNRSYAEMIALGQAHLAVDNYTDAMYSFFDAKTIFPDRIQPRKNLCYIYLMQCRENDRYCSLAKREIYYAMKYVGDADVRSKEYIETLADLLEMEPLLGMSEGEAMSAIF